MEQNKKEIPDFSQLERSRVPGEFTWESSDIYPGFEEWREEKARLPEKIAKIKEFEKNWTGSAQELLRLFTHIDDVEKMISRLHVYANLFADTDMADSSYQAKKGEIEVIDVNLQSLLSFIRPGILKLGKDKIAAYMNAEPGLKVYELFFDSVLRQKKHILSADKEEITALTGLFSGAAENAAEMLNNLEIPFPRVTLSDGKKVRLNQANYIRHREAKERPDRRKVMRTFWKHHARFKNTLAVLLDGEIKNHYFNVRVRRYDSCLQAALFPKNIDVKVYRTLIKTVKENLEPLHRYLNLKARMLKLEQLDYDDIYASSVPAVDEVFTIEEAESLVLAALGPLGPDYRGVLRQGFQQRWMDIYPNRGKRSGAYCNGGIYDGHPYVLMNYNGTFNTVSTLAHEFGHALHSYFSNKTQPYPRAHYPIFLAEIASTFNEDLLVNHLLETKTDDLFKLFILDQYIEGLRGTIYRQTLFADFELAMHEEVERGGTLTPGWLDKKYLGLTRLYYGHKKGVMKVGKYIENEWSGIPHFYYNFYVYQYSTGIAAAMALADRVLHGGEADRESYLDLLKAGGSDYPLNILKRAGVDLTTPEPVLAAIKKIDVLVAEMEKIAARLA
ncbi:MAG: oligoendopeptidase F [Candidatus Aminicenantes bacterium]|nr:oligoendopeptidase F [Candidatus Aminicenantes bacterium]